jgi:hypothetical protein
MYPLQEDFFHVVETSTPSPNSEPMKGMNFDQTRPYRTAQ